jgi:hypothetical protein
MRKLIVVSLFIFWAIITIKAQKQPSGNSNNSKIFNQESEKVTSGSSLQDTVDPWAKHLIINSDSRVDTLIQIHREENIRKRGIDGFRVQIFQGTYEVANQIKAKFISNHENIFADVFFPSPFAVVKVGDCRTKSEAIKLKNLVKNEYPSAYIVEDVINLPDLGEKVKDY